MPTFLLYGENTSFTSKNNKNNGFILALKDVKIDTFYESENQIQVFILYTYIIFILKLVDLLRYDIFEI